LLFMDDDGKAISAFLMYDTHSSIFSYARGGVTEHNACL